MNRQPSTCSSCGQPFIENGWIDRQSVVDTEADQIHLDPGDHHHVCRPLRTEARTTRQTR